MNEWRNEIMERVHLFAPTKTTIEGSLVGDAGQPEINYKSSLRVMPFDLSEHPELARMLKERFLMLLFHPTTLTALNLLEFLVDCRLAAERMQDEGLPPVPEGMLPPSTSPLPLVVADGIDLGELKDALQVEPLESIPWVQVITAVRMFSGPMHPVPPVLLIDASRSDLPPFARWVLHGTHENGELDAELADPNVPAAIRERLVQYIASRSNPLRTSDPTFHTAHRSAPSTTGSSRRN